MNIQARRFVAGMFDFILLCLFVAGFAEVHGIALSMLVFFGGIVLWLELCWRLKGSLGKAMVNIGIAFPGRGKVLLRELIGKSASFLTMGLGFVPILFHDHKGLEDYVADTEVVPWPRSKGTVDTARIAVAIVMSVAIGLAFAGIKNTAASTAAPVDSTSNTVVPGAAKPSAGRPWSVSDAMNAVMTINVYKGRTLQAQGSGFLVSTDGRAITNVHVLRDGDNAEVELGDGRKFVVTSIVAFDAAKDLVLFRIGPKDSVSSAPATYPKLTLGASKDIEIGDKIIVIGSPEGLNNTVSEGIFSARRPATSDEQATIQVSAPISPGSSGGPVFDDAGSVVGVAQSTLEEGQNLNFAIPVEVVQQLLQGPAVNLSPADFYSRIARTVPPEEDASENEEPSLPPAPPARTQPQPQPSPAPTPAPPAPAPHKTPAPYQAPPARQAPQPRQPPIQHRSPPTRQPQYPGNDRNSEVTGTITSSRGHN